MHYSNARCRAPRTRDRARRHPWERDAELTHPDPRGCAIGRLACLAYRGSISLTDAPKGRSAPSILVCRVDLIIRGTTGCGVGRGTSSEGGQRFCVLGAASRRPHPTAALTTPQRRTPRIHQRTLNYEEPLRQRLLQQLRQEHRLRAAVDARLLLLSVNHHWLEVYHVDGFRYDCVPNYWDGPLGVGCASLVYETYRLTKSKLDGPLSRWSRFDGAGEPLRLIQCAEQLVGKQQIGAVTDGSSRRAFARGHRRSDNGLSLPLAALRGHRVCLRTKRQYRVVGQLHTR
jgi:hypothetical protein